MGLDLNHVQLRVKHKQGLLDLTLLELLRHLNLRSLLALCHDHSGFDTDDAIRGNALRGGSPKLPTGGHTQVHRPGCSRLLLEALLLQNEGVRHALICPEAEQHCRLSLPEPQRLSHRLETIFAEYSLDLPVHARVHELEESPRNASLIDLVIDTCNLRLDAFLLDRQDGTED